jgi:hypothetical protein
MHKQQAKIDFSDFTQSEFSPAAHEIQSTMVTNAALYPAPPITMAALLALIGAYDLIIEKPEYVGRTGDLSNARIAVEGALKTNGGYVNGIALGDVAKLEKSGYPISKAHSPIGNLLPPAFVNVKNGTAPLTFDFNIATVDNAKGYLIAFTLMTNPVTDPNLWTIVWSSKHTNTFAGFLTNTQYKFAACAVGAGNAVFWKNCAEDLFAR